MMSVVFRAMARGFLRDRGALALAVVMPLAVFVVFAAVFSGATGEQLKIKVAVADEQRSEPSGRLVAALNLDSALIVTSAESAEQVRDAVASGAADAGLVIRAAARPLADLTGDGEAPIAIVSDAVRAVAARVLAGQVQRAYFTALPDAALRSTAELLGQAFVTFTPGQRDTLDERFAELGREMADPDNIGAAEGPFDGLVTRTPVGITSLGASHVAYYAGAVAILFLLFSAVHGALSLLEERDSGLLDRVLAGPGGMGAVIGGKFLFLVVQGIIQVTLIFLLAWVGWQVRVPDRFVGFLVVTVAASVAAAGLALALTTACRTKRQAQTFANIAILVLSAVGGSMVPRFLMPPALQTLGWFTPTTWAVEAFSGLFWRGAPLLALAPPILALFVSGLAGLALARVFARRDEFV